MQVIPAIDLRGGRCVRLRQGDYDQETVFGDDPAAMAAHWAAEGATRIHLVDLDGAKQGCPVNVAAVRAILGSVRVPCQLGGGVRDEATIAAWLDAGLERVIVGTRALTEPSWFRTMARNYPGRLVLGLDARDGRVATGGWLDLSSVEATTLAERFDDLPLAAVVYTDIARDGMLAGPNLAATEALAVRLKTPVLASGGVGTLEDLGRLAALPIAACIVGRALYEGRFRLADARERAGDRSATREAGPRRPAPIGVPRPAGLHPRRELPPIPKGDETP
ncbi:MAG TPA: 1-(5-phosphoribosyl)-5-[(5-phosphoribosylamino)methylideneamino]imidazole-4-carboxamide isomerase [Isosphaeraceae bacterium]|nr:1-(5-phosphoribosyl)-5-[(5-phosphoribosylamino)methylideneamino]imidazole-4-carboxamide isomerase [Isosphaeraceae bacterium]